MNWFRKHVKTGSRLALFALAIQFALSFGHFHGEVARAAPAAIEAGLADADLAIAATLATPQAPSEAAAQESARTGVPAPADPVADSVAEGTPPSLPPRRNRKSPAKRL